MGQIKKNPAQEPFGQFLAIHKVFLRKTAIARTQFFSGFALAELCGAAFEPVKRRGNKRCSLLLGSPRQHSRACAAGRRFYTLQDGGKRVIMFSGIPVPGDCPAREKRRAGIEEEYP